MNTRVRVIDRGVSHRVSHDHTRLVDTEMELLPPALPALPVFRRGPFTLTHNRQAGAIDEEMRVSTPWNVSKRKVDVLPAPGQRGVIGRPKVELHQPQERREKAFGLPQRQMEEEPQREGCFDRDVRILLLRAPGARSSRFPGRDGCPRQPDRDFAPTDQGSIVGGPVSDAVFRLVLGWTLDFIHPV